MDRMIPDRTASMWNRTAAYKAEQAESKACQLCGEDEAAGRIWICKALEDTRKEADEEIASIEPKGLPAAVKQRIARAMNMDIRTAFWGSEVNKEDSKEAQKLCGCQPERVLTNAMKEINEKCGSRFSARAIMQHHINEEEGEELPMPQHIATKQPPPEPNAYSDGSLKNPGVGPPWMIGGIGVWWPGRKETTIPQTEAERKFSRTTFE